MEHEMLPECKEIITRLSHADAANAEAINKVAEATKETSEQLGNHYTELKAVQAEIKTDISWIKKIMEKWWLVVLGLLTVSGGSTALADYLMK